MNSLEKMENSFYSLYLGTIVKPSDTFEILIKDERNLSKGFYAVSITAILYTFVYLFLILGGGQPFKPWLNIPLETYYRYNVFFCAPSMFLGWILATGVVHLCSKPFSSTGSFEQTLIVFGFGISVSTWSTGIHDLTSSFLGAIHVIDQHDYETALNTPTIWRTLLWIQMLVYLVWFIVLFSKGVKSVYRISSLLSSIIGACGFLVYQLFFIIFNR